MSDSKIICDGTENILTKLNTHLSDCSTYSLSCFTMDQTELLNEMYALAKDTDDCHDIQRMLGYVETDNQTVKYYLIAAHDSKTGNMVSYITFSLELSTTHGFQFVLINFACTNIDNRRKGLSIMLILVPMMFARDNRIQFVVADTNVKSAGLLKKYYGFTITQDYQDIFNYVGKSWIDVNTTEFDNILKDRIGDICKIYPI